MTQAPVTTTRHTPAQKPLEGLLVVDLSQFLSGPYASLRLADLGARVIKVERPEVGDICRILYTSNQQIDGDSTLFHAINRNKEGFAVDLKSSTGLEQINTLIARADILIQNFRPGVIERIGLTYARTQEINPRLIYASVSGYGADGPWQNKPGQDLLVQALSGLCWLQDAGKPQPFGLAIADMMAGNHLCQGILAALVRRGISGLGAQVEVSLMESLIDFQFEHLTAYFHAIREYPGKVAASSLSLAASPVGRTTSYQTCDGYVLLHNDELPILCASWGLSAKDQAALARKLQQHSTEHWMELLPALGVKATPIFNWLQLRQQEGFRRLEFFQDIHLKHGKKFGTTRCPILINGEPLLSTRPAPGIGEHNETILEELF